MHGKAAQRLDKQDTLNPFKCPEMIKNYERKMIDDVKRMEGDDPQTTEDVPPSN